MLRRKKQMPFRNGKDTVCKMAVPKRLKPPFGPIWEPTSDWCFIAR